jgi:hypothetical protein
MKLSSTIVQRFWSRVERQPNGCLLWVGVTSAGYGMLSVAAGVSRGAHHVAWFLHTGRWPTFLRHTCDTPLCCEFNHLLAGDAATNYHDSAERGRNSFGERHGMSKLTCDEVVEMRRLRHEGALLRELAERFDVTEANVSSICRGKTRRLG